MSEEKAPPLPAMDRTRIRIFIGSLKMVQGQLAELPDVLFADKVELRRPLAQWQDWAETVYASTVDAPSEETSRPKTMDAET